MSATTALSHVRSRAPSPACFSSDTKGEDLLLASKQCSTISAHSDEGWVCRTNGQCDLFPKLDLSRVQVLCISPSKRLFRIIERQPSGKPDHIITWGESKGVGLVVWSTFATKLNRRNAEAPPTRKTTIHCTRPTKLNVNFGLRSRAFMAISEACLNPSDRILNLGAVTVRQVRWDWREAEWHIFPPASRKRGVTVKLNRTIPKA
ncbi:hypothetical protein NLG97_g4478 [Lecanicillium saksenae]|uniref:Uncharacterized protein n=1 Tax=Lecanicillium saksenae TaxID=468837 RepID=A0ACC1QWV8_9HYPO|nr:hypothetical protein NLG97_g4478 [Lecanicillium saksenae]